MKITTKGFYAVEILRALASWRRSLPMSLADVEEKTGIPRDYVERLLLRLKRAGFAESFRGNAGGYRISQKPRDISLADIFKAAGEDIAPWFTQSSPRGQLVLSKKRSQRPIVCPLHPVWQRLYAANRAFFEKTTLADFL